MKAHGQDSGEIKGEPNHYTIPTCPPLPPPPPTRERLGCRDLMADMRTHTAAHRQWLKLVELHVLAI